MERHADALRSAGLQVYALSNEPSADQVALQRRLGGRVRFLSDPTGAALDALGLRDERGAPWYDRVFAGARPGDIPMPATLVVGADGRVRMVYRSERIDDRPPASELIARATAAVRANAATGERRA
ncbi:MAG: hypothetical protein D6689_17570 [Deltaproteobacteria bacterium]|nr:MAG: hypothetical protein D6689_17570 [Deltaproteobacteria bacterium]